MATSNIETPEQLENHMQEALDSGAYAATIHSGPYAGTYVRVLGEMRSLDSVMKNLDAVYEKLCEEK